MSFSASIHITAIYGMPQRGFLNKRSVHPQGARNCSLKKVLQAMQQYFTHNNATRVTPEALAERYEKDTRRALLTKYFCYCSLKPVRSAHAGVRHAAAGDAEFKQCACRFLPDGHYLRIGKQLQQLSGVNDPYV